MPLREWMYTKHNTFWDIVVIIILESETHVQREVSHLFPRNTQRWVDILITKKCFGTLMDIVIIDLIRIDMMQRTLMTITHVMIMVI